MAVSSMVRAQFRESITWSLPCMPPPGVLGCRYDTAGWGGRRARKLTQISHAGGLVFCPRCVTVESDSINPSREAPMFWRLTLPVLGTYLATFTLLALILAVTAGDYASAVWNLEVVLVVGLAGAVALALVCRAL